MGSSLSFAQWFAICALGVGLALILDGIREAYFANRDAKRERRYH